MSIPYIVGHIEKMADKEGKGSVFRACVAVQRSCHNAILGKKILELGASYASGKNTLDELKDICEKEMVNSKEDYQEALKALRNAIIISKPSSLEERKELWERLARLVDQ